MVNIIKVVSINEITKLDKFLSEYSNGNFFQSIQTYEFLSSVNNYEPVFIVAEEDDKLIGSLLAVLIRDGNGIKGFLSRRCIVWGGPLIMGDDPEIYSKILIKLNEVVSKKTIYTEFRNFRDLSDQKTLFEKAGYSFNDHLNYIVSISSIEEAKAKLSNSKKRQINKSIKKGAQIVIAESIEEVKDFYNILENLYKEKVKKPLPSFVIFEKFFNNKELGKYLIVKYNGKNIGGIMCPIYEETIYEWFVCGLDGQFEDVYPSVLATWAPIEYAAKNGLKYFDFMGAGKPDNDYGVREFKSKFGGELVNHGRFIRINNNILYNIGKMGLKLLGKI